MPHAAIFRIVLGQKIALPVVVAMVSLTVSDVTSAQAPAITLSAPTGAAAPPGGSVAVSVVTAPGSPVVRALVGGFDDLKQIDAFPATVAFAIPSDAHVGVYFVNAVGLSSSGQEFKAEPLILYVERSDPPVALSVERSPLAFPYQGIRQSISPIARFADGTRIEVRESPRLVYSTSNASVAAVDANGIVTAISSGQASIGLAYDTGTQLLRMTVPVTVGRAILEASPSSLDFGPQPIGSSSTLAFTLRNVARAPLDIYPIASTPEFAVGGTCIAGAPLGPNASCEVSVVFTPMASGQRRAIIQVENAAFSPPLGVLVSGEGLGLRASSTTLGSSANPSVLGQAVTVTATVTDATGSGTPTPTGEAAFASAAGALDSAPLAAGGAASATVTGLGAGSHAITATYSGDAAFGPSTSAPLTQVVRYAATCAGGQGRQILPPVNADGTSVFRQGRTVPAKFRVCDANGQSIGTAGVVQDFRLTQVISGTASDVNENVPSTTPDTAFRWDAAEQQWVFNISTAGQEAQKTYVYTITLNDGTTISFRYGLR